MENKMKRITSIILILATLLSLTLLTSCKKSDAPEGMQLVKGGADYAYSFYAPEEWVVANLGEVACTYASRVDTTSMTFVETTRPEGSIKDYFESEKALFPYEITVLTDGESCSFGNADKLALKYVYTYEYKKAGYTCMQIFVENGEQFYIFTYTASNDDRAPETSYYKYYLEKVQASIDAFKFNNKTSPAPTAPSYEKDSDGYLLVSDKRIAGFSLFVPDTYSVDHASALVSVSSGGKNITMSETTYPATTQDEYWKKRREDIEAIADKITDEDGKQISSFKEISASEKTDAANADAAVKYEYSYILDGVEYRVCQILARKGTLGGSVYVFTYTATIDEYDDGLGEAMTIFKKVQY